MNSFVQMPYIKGNNDDCDLYAIGGRSLYDKMTDPNPLKRGYYFLSQTIGINSEIEIVYQWVKDLKDKNTFAMLDGAKSENTILDILDVWFRTKQTNPPMLLQNYNFIDNGVELKVIHKNNNYWSILQVEINKSKKNIPMLLLNYAFKQTIGSYIDNIFMSKQFVVNDKLILMPGLTTSKGFKFTDKLKREVNMLQDNYSKYSLPLYKYQSDLIPVDLQFINPSGYNLIQITLDNTIHKNNSVVFLFTNTVLDNGYNFYII
jgi:hypothetical protein